MSKFWKYKNWLWNNLEKQCPLFSGSSINFHHKNIPMLVFVRLGQPVHVYVDFRPSNLKRNNSPINSHSSADNFQILSEFFSIGLCLTVGWIFGRKTKIVNFVGTSIIRFAWKKKFKPRLSINFDGRKFFVEFCYTRIKHPCRRTLEIKL